MKRTFSGMLFINMMAANAELQMLKQHSREKLLRCIVASLASLR
jgi:hypothetical protein